MLFAQSQSSFGDHAPESGPPGYRKRKSSKPAECGPTDPKLQMNEYPDSKPKEETPYIYVFGGICEGVGVRTAQRFNIATGNWEYTARNQLMPHNGIGIGVTEHGGQIWIVGGDDARLTYVYDPINDDWLPQATLNVHREDLVAVDYIRRLFAIAGKDGDVVLRSMERYNDCEKKWEVMDAELKQKRFNFRATVFNGKIYVYGGCADVDSGSGLTSLECYDGRCWIITKVAERVRKGCFGFFALDDTLFMVGGDTFNTISMSTNAVRWNRVGRLSQPSGSEISCHSVYIAVGYKIYVFGGLVRPGNDAPHAHTSAVVYDLSGIQGTHGDATHGDASINPLQLADMTLPRLAPGAIFISHVRD